MAKVNYIIWPKIIKFLLVVGICITSIGFALSLIGQFTNVDFSVQGFDYGYRNYKNGYPVKANMYVDIPNTVISYKKGTMTYDFKYGYRWASKSNAEVKDIIVNLIKPNKKYHLSDSALKKEGIKVDSISNFISIPNKVDIRVKTENAFHKSFYILYSQLNNIFIIIISLWLIMLINDYETGNFLKERSFKLISRIGNTFIWMNVVTFIFDTACVYILPDFNLTSISKISGNLNNQVGLHLATHIKFDLTYLIFGISILILADIIKNAVLIKKEQDLTI